MFQPAFAEYSLREEGGPARDRRPQVEHFTTPGVVPTLGAIQGADTSKRSVALRIESVLAGKEVTGHEDAALAAILEDWMRITHHIMDYQYVHDMNTYVRAVQTDERTRLEQQYNTITNDVMVKRNMYLMRERDSVKLQSRVRILLHTMLFVSTAAFLYANRAFFGPFGWTALVLASVAFCVYVMMYIKVTGSRRYNDWDSMYFNDGGEISTEQGDGDLDSDAQCDTVGSVPFSTV